MSDFRIVESTGHGKNVAGNKRTSSIQVREHGVIRGAYLLRKQFRFIVGDSISKAKAWDKANAFVAAMQDPLGNEAPVVEESVMNRRELLAERIGYLKGVIATMELYAIWNDGERFIGVMREPLKEAVKPFQAECEKLALELSDLA